MKNILETIGETPMISKLNMNSESEGKICLKYERNNPGGSVKDRPALYMINEAEKRGWLKPGGTIIESSSGNFGISLAMIGAARNYRVIILVDPKTTASNMALLKSFGAEVVVVTEKDDCGSYHKTRIALANKMAREIDNSFRPDQCFCLLNSKAHYDITAKEILQDCENNLSVFIAPVSTGGQLGGISRFLKEKNPDIKVVGVEAEGSIIFGGVPHSYVTPGIGLGWMPNNIQPEYIDEAYKIPDEQAFLTARAVAQNEGILIGPSSGACVLVALKLAQQLKENHRIVCMISDGGERYTSTLFNDDWMAAQGFSTGDTTDIESIRKMACNLQPCCFEKSIALHRLAYLEEQMQIPESTQIVNKDILRKQVSRGPYL
jgi:cystathionine beta-synthase/cysteine synthase A